MSADDDIHPRLHVHFDSREPKRVELRGLRPASVFFNDIPQNDPLMLIDMVNANGQMVAVNLKTGAVVPFEGKDKIIPVANATVHVLRQP